MRQDELQEAIDKATATLVELKNMPTSEIYIATLEDLKLLMKERMRRSPCNVCGGSK